MLISIVRLKLPKGAEEYSGSLMSFATDAFGASVTPCRESSESGSSRSGV